MGRAIWLASLVTGCFSAHAVDGLPCSETLDCPIGQTCDPRTLVCYAEPPPPMLATGDDHTCAIDASGALRCWGHNNSGQLGVGDVNDRNAPTQVGTDTDWVFIAAAGDGTCGLRGAARALYCWGDRYVVGNDSNVPVAVPAPAPGGGVWRAISLGTVTMCALDAAGAIWCRYYDDSQPMHRLDEAPANIAQISAGDHYQCVIDDDHRLYCWGVNGSGQVGDGTNSGNTSVDSPYQHPGTWRSVAAGRGHVCAIDSSLHLWCWGDCVQDQSLYDPGPNAGYCNMPSMIGPDGVTDPDHYLTVAARGDFTCAVRADHVMVCFGRNLEGQLGTSTIGQISTPVEIPAISDWTAVVAGDSHACAFRSDDSIWCWGHDDRGQLGDGQGPTLQNTPVQVDTASTWAQVSVGLAFTCALQTDATLWCWGENGAGQLGDGTTTRRTTPETISPATSQVWAGGTHACAINAAGALLCWGDDRHGQLGLGNTADVTEHAPRRVGTRSDWSAVAAGNIDTLALASDGLYYWGDDTAQPTQVSSITQWTFLTGHGRNDSKTGGLAAKTLSDGSIHVANAAMLGPGDPKYTGTGTGPNWSDLARGTSHTCGIDAASGNAMLCWGTNYNGELGIATTPPDATTTVLVTGAATSSWFSVDAGDYGTCGIGSDHGLYCWGKSVLVPTPIVGDYTSTPQAIMPGTTWLSVSIADHHGCAIEAPQGSSGGKLWCWGDNLAGELGVGPTSQNTPVRVVLPGAP